MTDAGDIRDDLEAAIDEDLVVLARRLRDDRPVPRAAFRGDLGRHLERRARPRLSPAGLRVMIASYAVGGAALLCIGTVSAAGLGPLG